MGSRTRNTVLAVERREHLQWAVSCPASCGWWRPGTHLGQAGVWGSQGQCALGAEMDVWWQKGSLVPARFLSQAACELQV